MLIFGWTIAWIEFPEEEQRKRIGKVIFEHCLTKCLCPCSCACLDKLGKKKSTGVLAETKLQ